jgi:hypothetical protein
MTTLSLPETLPPLCPPLRPPHVAAMPYAAAAATPSAVHRRAVRRGRRAPLSWPRVTPAFVS